MKQQPLVEYVHHLSDCPTREIGRGDEGCTCGAPHIIADIELAYGLLWCVLGTDKRTHRARMLLAKALGPDGMKRGLRAKRRLCDGAVRMNKQPTTPAALAREAQKRELAAIRKRAWITRRKKYGPNGNGKYHATGR